MMCAVCSRVVRGVHDDARLVRTDRHRKLGARVSFYGSLHQNFLRG
jgi:hypothetical protein